MISSLLNGAPPVQISLCLTFSKQALNFQTYRRVLNRSFWSYATVLEPSKGPAKKPHLPGAAWPIAFWKFAFPFGQTIQKEAMTFTCQTDEGFILKLDRKNRPGHGQIPLTGSQKSRGVHKVSFMVLGSWQYIFHILECKWRFNCFRGILKGQ